VNMGIHVRQGGGNKDTTQSSNNKSRISQGL
jgi:hypothetical protein